MTPIHCCDRMREELQKACPDGHAPFQCPDALVSYDEKCDEYGLVIHDGGSSSVLISFCPWCGTRLPESKRERWFQELARRGIDPMADALRTTKSWHELTKDEWMGRGERIVTLLTPEELTAWAGRVLAAASAVHAPVPEVEEVVSASQDPARWASCRGLFHSIRQRTLLAEASSTPDALLVGLLCLAEIVAKVAYNASGGPAPFDADSGAWIPLCTRNLLASLHDLSSREQLESVLSSALAPGVVA